MYRGSGWLIFCLPTTWKKTEKNVAVGGVCKVAVCTALRIRLPVYLSASNNSVRACVSAVSDGYSVAAVCVRSDIFHLP